MHVPNLMLIEMSNENLAEICRIWLEKWTEPQCGVMLDTSLCTQPVNSLMQLIWPLLMCVARGGGDGLRGVFVELGAYDGITSSNTLVLEKCHGWRGVLIEGNPTNYRFLASSGRNASRFVHSAVSSRCHGGVSNFTTLKGEVSGIAEVMAARLQGNRYLYKAANPHHFVKVPCKRLSTILDESLAHLSKIAAPLRSFDFFSLDTEGTEDVVLESLLGGSTAASGDASRDPANGGADATGTAGAVSDGDANGTGAWWLPKVVLVEAVGPVTKDNSVDKMLKAANYTRRHALELKTVDKRKPRGPGIVRNRVYTRLNSAEVLRCAKLLKGGGRST